MTKAVVELNMAINLGLRDPRTTELKGFDFVIHVASRTMLVEALNESGWNRLVAARKLGLSRNRMYSLCQKYGLSRNVVTDDD